MHELSSAHRNLLFAIESASSSDSKAEDEPDIASKLNALQYRHGTSLKDRTQTLLDDVLLLLPGLLLVCFRAYTGHLWYHSDRMYKEGYFHVKRK